MNEQLSRKDFFKEIINRFDLRKIAGANPPPEKKRPVVAPPGIKNVSEFLNQCNQCYDCVSVCPHEALQVWHQEGANFDGYPVIYPRRQPCYLCQDFPCIQACPTEALQMEFSGKPMGKAVIDESRCLAFQDHFCQSCITNCPPDYSALQRNDLGHPVVDTEKCSGCGICTHVCPAETPAINIYQT